MLTDFIFYIEYTLFFRGILKLYIISKGYKKVPSLNEWTPSRLRYLKAS